MSVHRVLLADDEPVQRKLALLRLSHAGFRVEGAEDGADALERIRRQPPDAVVTDLQMPRLDGLGLCRAVKADPGLSSIPVIVCSAARIEPAVREQGLRAGADLVVQRTPDVAAVIDALYACLGRHGVPTAGPLLDEATVARLRRLAAGEPAGFLEEIAGLFLSTAAESRATILDALAVADGERLAAGAHRLAGAARTMGALRVVQACRALEDLARAGRLDGCPPVVARLLEDLEASGTAVAGLKEDV